jgi:hypothetical protein
VCGWISPSKGCALSEQNVLFVPLDQYADREMANPAAVANPVSA